MLRENIIKNDSLGEYVKEFQKIIFHESSVAIWGSGRGGVKVLELLKRINWNGSITFIDSDPFKQGKLYAEMYEVISPEQFFGQQNANDIWIVISCADVNGVLETVHKFSRYEKVMGLDLTSIDFDEHPFQYIWDHIEKLEDVYALLEDEKSKKVFSGMLNYRISRDKKYLEDIVDDAESQYFDADIIGNNISVFVDAGAYIGDTVEKFMELYGQNYSKVFCMEPDKENYQLLCNNVQNNNWDRVFTYNIGLHSKSEKLRFDTISRGGGTSNHVAEDGNVIVDVNRLDAIIEESVDLIKMDIEGSELEALKGSEQIIKKYRPALAICIYHKKEDYFEIPKLIHELCNQYKFYVRQYSFSDAETILYAVVK